MKLELNSFFTQKAKTLKSFAYDSQIDFFIYFWFTDS